MSHGLSFNMSEHMERDCVSMNCDADIIWNCVAVFLLAAYMRRVMEADDSKIVPP